MEELSDHDVSVMALDFIPPKIDEVLGFCNGLVLYNSEGGIVRDTIADGVPEFYVESLCFSISHKLYTKSKVRSTLTLSIILYTIQVTLIEAQFRISKG